MWISGLDSGNSGGHRSEESDLLVLPCHEVVERHGKAVNEIGSAVAAPHPHLIVFFVDVVVRDCHVEHLGEFSDYLLYCNIDTETVGYLESIAQFHESRLLRLPVECDIVDTVFKRHTFDVNLLDVADCTAYQRECLGDEGGEVIVDFLAHCVGLYVRNFHLSI